VFAVLEEANRAAAANEIMIILGNPYASQTVSRPDSIEFQLASALSVVDRSVGPSTRRRYPEDVITWALALAIFWLTGKSCFRRN